jgi:hypothetical protein
VWVAARGFASATNRAYLTKGGGHYIHAEKLRHTNTEAAAALARPGRYRTVAGNLCVKEVHVAPGGDGDGASGGVGEHVRSGSWSATTPRPRCATPPSGPTWSTTSSS